MRKEAEILKKEKADMQEKLFQMEQVSRNKRHVVSKAEAAALVEADLARAEKAVARGATRLRNQNTELRVDAIDARAMLQIRRGAAQMQESLHLR